MANENVYSRNLPSLELLSRDFFILLRRHYLIFFSVIVLFAIGGLAYSSLKKPEFKSRLTFSLDEGSGGAAYGDASALANQLGISLSGNEGLFSQENIIEIMRSRKIIEDILLTEHNFSGRNQKLIEYYLENFKKSASKKNKVLFPLNSKKTDLNAEQKKILKEVSGEINESYLSIQRPDRNLSIYQVSVQSANDTFSKVFTDKLVFATDSFYHQIRTEKSAKILRLLEERAEEYRKSLFESIDTKSEIIDANINPAFATSVAPIEKKQYYVELYGKGYGELFRNLELARFQLLKDTPLLQIIDEADYPMDIVKINKVYAAVTGAIAGLMIFMITAITLILRRIIKTHPQKQ